MDLKDNNITIGALLDNPKAKAILQREFPTLMSHPLVKMARGRTLKDILPLARGKVSQEKIDATLAALRAL